jgi:hypothetical protein
LDGAQAMLWTDEQRGIGELMMGDLAGGRCPVIGHAAFHQRYERTFAAWMERFAADVLAPAAPSADRLRLLHWALFGLVTMLDDERSLRETDWTTRACAEIRASSAEVATPAEQRLIEHLQHAGVV